MPQIDFLVSAYVSGPPSFTIGANIASSGVAEGGVGEPGVFAEVETEFTIEAEIDASAMEMAFPAPGFVQEAGIEVRVSGTGINRTFVVNDYSVSRSRRSVTQQYSFVIKLEEWGIDPLGDPFLKLGSPTGKEEIDIYGVYRHPTTFAIAKFPLIRRGVIDNVQRTSSPDGGHMDSFNGADAAVRYQRQPVTIIYPPGHGMRREQMGEKALRTAGETHFRLEQCHQAWKEVQLIDADAAGNFQEWVDVEGRQVRWDRNGDVVCPKLYRPPPAVAPFEIDEEDILSLSVITVSFPADVVTEVTATGNQQLLADEDDGAKTSCRTVSTYKVYRPFHASFVQNTDCTLSVVPPDGGPSPERILVNLVEVCQTFRDGVLIREETKEWQWAIPEAARFYWVAGDTWHCIAGVYLSSGAVAGSGDSTIAHPVPREKWTLVHHVITNHFYNALGWAGPPPVFGDARVVQPWVGHFGEHYDPAVQGYSGEYLGSDTWTYGWYNQRTALKQVVPGTSLEDTEPRNGVKVTAEKKAVKNYAQSFGLTNREVKTVEGANDGFVARESSFSYAWAPIPDGDSYLFEDGTPSSTADELMILVNSDSTAYTLGEENSHTEVRVTEPIRQQSEVVVSTKEGGPPAMTYLPGYEPAQDHNQMTEEDLANSSPARIQETQPIKVFIAVPELLTDHLPRIVKVDFPYAETADELDEAATSIIRDSMIVGIDLELAVNFALAEDIFVKLTHHPAGLVDKMCIIDSITWSGAPESPQTTSLHLELYPDG